MSLPLVTVVLPVFNGAATLLAAARSVLSQDFADFELLIVNDGSTDRTREVLSGLASPRLRVIDLPVNIGRAAARNIGVSKARGKYVAMMDADDESCPDRLREQAAFLESCPEIAMCGSWARYLDAGGRALQWRQPTTPEAIRAAMLRSNAFIHSSVMARKSVLEQAGGYDESLPWAEDYDLCLRIVAGHQTVNIPRILVAYHGRSGAEYRALEQWYQFRVRWRALSRYGYPWRQAVYLALPLLTALLPVRWKLALKRRLVL